MKHQRAARHPDNPETSVVYDTHTCEGHDCPGFRDRPTDDEIRRLAR